MSSCDFHAFAWMPEKVTVQGAISVWREKVRLNPVMPEHNGKNRIDIFPDGSMLLESTGFNRSLLNGGERWLAFLILRSGTHCLYSDEGDAIPLREGEVVLIDSRYAFSMKRKSRSAKNGSILSAMLVKGYARKPAQESVERTLIGMKIKAF